MIKITLTSNAREILKQFEVLPARMMRGLAAALDLENEFTLGEVQKRRLSGPTTPTTLSVRTNRLRRSMNTGDSFNIFERATASGTVVSSAIGSNVRYAGVHEYGFDGEVMVPGHTRKNITRQSFKFGGKAVRRNVRGADINVGAHKRRVSIPARAYLRRTIEECIPNYERALSEAVVNAWNAGGNPA